MVISKRFTREQGVIHQYSLFFYEITISSKVESLTWHLMFRTFLFHLSIISSGSLDINMQRISVESNAFHLWLNVMLLHFNRKVWNFRQALASPNSICGHFMLGSYVYFHIPSLADILHTYCKTFIGWQSVFLWGPLPYFQQLPWTGPWNGDSSAHCHQNSSYIPLVLPAISKTCIMFQIHPQNLKHLHFYTSLQ